jgi:hypothetical protein
MIRWLLLIPFALLIAIGASGTFFLIATIVDPVMAVLTGDTLFVGLWSLVDAVFAAEDPGPIVEDAFLAVGRIVFTLLVFPPLMIAIISEVLGMRSLHWHGHPHGGRALHPARIGAGRLAGRVACEPRARTHRCGCRSRLLGDHRGARAQAAQSYRAVVRILIAKTENRPAKE